RHVAPGRRDGSHGAGADDGRPLWAGVLLGSPPHARARDPDRDRRDLRTHHDDGVAAGDGPGACGRRRRPCAQFRCLALHESAGAVLASRQRRDLRPRRPGSDRRRARRGVRAGAPSGAGESDRSVTLRVMDAATRRLGAWTWLALTTALAGPPVLVLISRRAFG